MPPQSRITFPLILIIYLRLTHIVKVEQFDGHSSFLSHCLAVSRHETTLTLDGTSFEADASEFADVQITNGAVVVPSVPEPGSFVLIAASSFGLLLRRRRC